ncbi:VIT1/CCC1 transporter family protein [Candidatus Saccharibacteria bacterium]|nr:VIT1/CCC1 transporter family protein [Candidatus Saccharibacteria bacterium]
MILSKRRMRSEARSHIAQFVYGATDGTVTTFAVVAGAVGGGFGANVALILGFANLFADGISMGVSAYLGEESDEEVRKIRNRRRALGRALITFGAFLSVGSITLWAYVWQFFFNGDSQKTFSISLILAILSFLFIGFVKALVTGASRIKSMLETLLLGGVAAGAAYIVGVLLEKAITK